MTQPVQFISPVERRHAQPAAAVIDTFIAALNARIDYYARAAARHGKRKTPDDQHPAASVAPDAGGNAEGSTPAAPGTAHGTGPGEAEITIPVPLEVDIIATAHAKKP
ncbi:MAG: hypothetical protein LBK99_11420 [Opitutaceae bacterium]|jgi:hypothetical protein|nr:hypothetical protein [Opitutaceae bacterium]